MLISMEHKAIFLHNPKTGGTSFRKVLRGEYGFEPLHKLFPRPRNDHSRDIPKKCRDFFIFTCCRNPYDRIVSSYTFQLQRENIKPVPFRTYIHSHVPYGLQMPFVALADVVLRFEDFTQSPDPIELPFGTFGLPHLNRTKRKPWQNYFFNSDDADLIYKKYEDDFAMLKYPRHIVICHAPRIVNTVTTVALT